MAGCFDFRMRASSFDMHQLAQRHKLAKFSKLFRSKSDTNVKGSPSVSPLASPKDSPKGSPSQQPRRRFMRVVRDADKSGEEYENPHIIRKYTQEYVAETFSPLQHSISLDEQGQKLPYTPQEDSILKKGLSLDTTNVSPAGSVSGGERTPPACGNKHASFKEEVEIIEFDKKAKIQKCECLKHKEKLHDDSDSDFLEESSESECFEPLPGDNKENTQPHFPSLPHDCDQDSIGAAATAATVPTVAVTEAAPKSLKDSSLKDIVNAEKAVNRDDNSDSSDSEQQPIKKSKKAAKVVTTTTPEKPTDNNCAKKQLAAVATATVSKTVAALDLDDMVMASKITKVHINPYLEQDESDGELFIESEAVQAVMEVVKAEL